MHEFSTLDIVRIFNIPRERLREWLNRGFIRPSVQGAKGQGTKAIFNRDDLYIIAMFRDLIENGLSRLSASACAHQIKRKDLSAISYVVFTYIRYRNRVVINARTGKSYKEKRDAVTATVRFVKNQAELKKVFGSKAPWDSILIVNLEKLKKEVDTIIGR